MGEEERPDVISRRSLAGVGNRRVVVEDIGEPGKTELLDEVAPNHGLDENISIPAQLVEVSPAMTTDRGPSSIR